MKPGSTRAGFSVVELLVMVGVVTLICFLVIVPAGRQKGSPQRIKCVNNLKNLALAARIFAIDNGDLPPGRAYLEKADKSRRIAADYFRTLSNELSTPNIIICPGDGDRMAAGSFTELTAKNISYFASLTARAPEQGVYLFGDRNLMVNGSTASSGVLTLSTNDNLGWSGAIHNGMGNVAMGDGSVQQFTSQRLQQHHRANATGTNLLVVP